MITNNEIEDGMVCVHEATQNKYIVINSRAQLKVGKDDAWLPAVVYKKKEDSSWNPAIFVRDTATFMANFSKEQANAESLARP